ncbi:hypothetical protein DLE60_19540 [Micromonospora globispora]|uniref:Uncharacterized protein n=1 Tax=Micromonospora globispora TaxID=1450148 RepID=A0A317K4L7_9ACTN|nr:hypothetical protein DLJ46_13025 [Micromonospora globispora]PWU58864.1 hypothetical protein DLE60_19540 [Micromonospora globispora]
MVGPIRPGSQRGRHPPRARGEPPRERADRTRAAPGSPHRPGPGLLHACLRVVVNLSASDLAGRRATEALQKPGRSNPDGSVRTVSGGLPTLNKRRR